MDPSPEQIKAFGAEARRLRRKAGLTAVEVATRLTAELGRTIPHQSVTAWERGEYGPQDTATAEAFDRIVDGAGALAALLVGSDLLTEVRTLRSEVADLRRLLIRLDTAIGAPPADGGAR